MRPRAAAAGGGRGRSLGRRLSARGKRRLGREPGPPFWRAGEAAAAGAV